MKLLKNLIRAIIGPKFRVYHVSDYFEAKGNYLKAFDADTWEDALEWMACALPTDVVLIYNRRKKVVARRDPGYGLTIY